MHPHGVLAHEVGVVIHDFEIVGAEAGAGGGGFHADGVENGGAAIGEGQAVAGFQFVCSDEAGLWSAEDVKRVIPGGVMVSLPSGGRSGNWRILPSSLSPSPSSSPPATPSQSRWVKRSP